MRFWRRFINKEYVRLFGRPKQCEHRTPMYVLEVPENGGVNVHSPLGDINAMLTSTIETPVQIAVFSGDPHKALCDLLQKFAPKTKEE